MSTRTRLIAALLGIAIVVAACGSATTPSPSPTAAPTPTPTPAATATPTATATPAASATPAAICADAAAFRASILALTSLKLVQVGTSGVKSALADVQSSAEALLASGKTLVAVPVANLLLAVKALGTTVTGLGDQPGLGASAIAIAAAIGQIKSAAEDVQAALGTTCPAQ